MSVTGNLLRQSVGTLMEKLSRWYIFPLLLVVRPVATRWPIFRGSSQGHKTVWKISKIPPISKRQSRNVPVGQQGPSGRRPIVHILAGQALCLLKNHCINYFRGSLVDLFLKFLSLSKGSLFPVIFQIVTFIPAYSNGRTLLNLFLFQLHLENDLHVNTHHPIIQQQSKCIPIHALPFQH